MTPSALAIDPGVTMGWCAAYGETLSCGEVKFSDKSDKRLGAFLLWLRPMLPSEVLVIERAVVAGPKRVNVALSNARMEGAATALAVSMGVAVVLLSPPEIKRTATGKGNASKEAMALWARAREWGRLERTITPTGEHEIDACAAMVCWLLRDFRQPKKKAKRKRGTA